MSTGVVWRHRLAAKTQWIAWLRTVVGTARCQRAWSGSTAWLRRRNELRDYELSPERRDVNGGGLAAPPGCEDAMNCATTNCRRYGKQGYSKKW